MKAYISGKAKKELDGMGKELRVIFIKYIEKMLKLPPGRHMKHGIPYHVDDITKQARIIYQINDDCLQIIRCFKNHKEYERWYKSYK